MQLQLYINLLKIDGKMSVIIASSLTGHRFIIAVLCSFVQFCAPRRKFVHSSLAIITARAFAAVLAHQMAIGVKNDPAWSIAGTSTVGRV